LKFSLSNKFRIAFILIIGFQAVVLAFMPLYFKELGFSAKQIAYLSAAENIANIVGPPIFASLSFGIAALSGVSALLLLPILGTKIFAWVLLFWTASLFLNRAALNQINELAIRLDLRSLINYSKVRMWGSIGFVVFLQGMGFYLELYGVEDALLIAFLLLILLGGFGFFIKDHRASSKAKSVMEFFREQADRKFFILYIALIGLYASHAPAYVYLSIHLQELGWSHSQISGAWNVGVLSEILVFYFFSKIEEKFDLVTLISISLCAAAFRWALLAYAENGYLILLTQCTHALTFAVSFVASQKLVSLWLPDNYRRSGQAALAAVSSGVGSLLGKLVAGGVAGQMGLKGDFSVLFLGASIVSLASFMVWSRLPEIQLEVAAGGIGIDSLPGEENQM